MKWVSCTCQSNGTSAIITPVSPPMTKVSSPPSTNRVGVLNTGRPDAKVAIHANTCIPAGTLTASDAAEDGRNKMAGTLKALNYARREQGIGGPDVPHFELLQSAEMGLALGLENVIHAALTTGAAAQSAVDKARRLAQYIAQPTDDHTDPSGASGVLLSAEQDERR